MKDMSNYISGIPSEDQQIMEEIKAERETLPYLIRSYVKGLPVTEIQKDIVNIDYTDFTSDVPIIKEPVKEDDFNTIIHEIKKIIKEIGIIGIKPPEVRFYNLPERLTKQIHELGAEDIHNLVSVEGTIIAVDNPKTRVEDASFTCKGCMRTYKIKQQDYNLIYPNVCNECGNREFNRNEKEDVYKDSIEVILEENNTDKTHQTRIKIILEDSLTHEIDVNMEVNVVGIASRDIGATKNNDTSKLTIIKANNVKPLKEKQIEVTEEDKQQLIDLSKNENILEILSNSLAPNIILDTEIKKALLCYLVKGTPIRQILRDDIHILFIADPSTAKSRIGNYITDFTNKYTKANGTSSTGVGLIGAVVKDPLLNTNVLELGAFPKANHGHCIIDEFDKLNYDDGKTLLDSLETGYTNIHKAGVHKENIESKVSVLCLANPKYGRYNPYKPIKDQITFYDALLSRFDLIFLLQDIPNLEKDTKIATAILAEDTIEKAEETVTQIDKETLKKYIEYARSIKPDLTKKAETHAKEYYTTVRNNSDNNENILSYDTRMFESLIRIASAISKLKLSTEITNTEIEEATKLIDYCLSSLGQDPDTSEIDIDRFRGNYDNADKRNRDNILEAISELSKESVDNGVKQKDLLTYVEDVYNIKRNTFYDVLNQLETHQDIFIKTSSARGNPKLVYLRNN